MQSNKLLGQHFLTCKWVLPELAKAANLGADDTVLEIGPGTGVLTRFLAERAKKVIAVEKDAALAQRLAYEFAIDCNQPADDRQKFVKNGYSMGPVEIIIGDILWFDFSILPEQYKVVANIPYYLTSRLIRILLELKKKPEIIVLTIQQEVAERAVAQAPDMNILALSIQSYGTPEIIASVPALCFNPKPKVDSAILKIADISEDFFVRHAIEPRDFFRIVRAGFSSRRKMLVNNLEAFRSKKELQKALHLIGKPETARAQELSLKEWAMLVRLFANRR